jgi:peptidyl-prolyl cis-trans isomerase SurA
MLKKFLPVVFLVCANFYAVYSQPFLIDRVAAIVGKNFILQSEIEGQMLQMRAQGIPVRSNTRCQIFEELLEQKLLINQAALDSIEVTDAEVEMEMNSRLQYFIRQIGSEEALEEYYNKSLLEIKEDLRDIVRDQLITREMQMEITFGVKVTPSEVRSFFNSLPTDSLPMINSQVELRQIVKNPEYSEIEKFEVKERLNNLRQRIIGGDDFSTMAILYSQDPGSARRGGELGFLSKTDLVPEFANVAFSLRDERISPVFETEFGFHIAQLIERRGDLVNVRHILMVPSASEEARLKARKTLDSIALAIRTDSITFRMAAAKYSDDEDTRMSGGLKINPSTRSARFELDQLDPAEYTAIRDLKVGEITNTFETRDERGKPVFKILQLVNQTPPHRANLKDDYDIIQDMALMDKKMKTLKQWLIEKQKKTYVRIDEDFKTCVFNNPGWLSKSTDK